MSKPASSPASEAPAEARGPAARLPRGFADRGPADIAATERMLAAIREVIGS